MSVKHSSPNDVSPARRELAGAGFAVVRNVGAGEEEFRAFVEAMGRPRGGTFWADIQTVRYRPGTAPEDSVAESRHHLAPHTDGTFESSPPELLFLQCVEPDLPGFGESYTVATQDLCGRLPGEVIDALSRPEFLFYRSSDGKAAQALSWVLSRDGAGRPLIRFRQDEKYRIRARSEAGAAAIEHLTATLREEALRRTIGVGRGAVLCLDNRRMLHARTALSGTVLREMRAAWADGGVLLPGEAEEEV